MANTPAVRASNRDLETLPFAEALEVYSPNLADALPEHIPLQRFKRVLVTAVNQNPDLAKADRRSLFNACVTCALDGLYPDGREAVLLTFRSRQKDGSYKIAATYIPMIAGVRKRMRNSGEVLSAMAEIVHKNDRFHYTHGDHPSLEHEPPPLDEERGPPIGAYAIVRLRNGETVREVMSLREIERIRSFSRAATKDDGPWVKHWGQMARKTVLKRAAHAAPISAEMEQLFRRDEEAERLLPPPPPRPTREQFATAAIEDDIVDQPAAEAPTFDVVRSDGEVISYDDPEDAATALLDLLRDARGDRRMLAALREDNDALCLVLADHGRADLVDEIDAACDTRNISPAPRPAPAEKAEQNAPGGHAEKSAAKPNSVAPLRDGAEDDHGAGPHIAKAADDPDETGNVGGHSPPQETSARPVARRQETPQPAASRAPAPIEMPRAFERQASFHETAVQQQTGAIASNAPAFHATTDAIEPPIRNGKPDYRTWRIVLFDAAMRKCTTVEDLATLIGDNFEHIENHDRQLPDQAAAFKARRDAVMDRLDKSNA